MNPSTASNRLKKEILFSFVRKAGENKCYQCGEEIKDVSTFSIEHKIPWLDSKSPTDLYFDLNNISFSHLSCNSKAARRNPFKVTHPSATHYRNGCRCDGCKAKHAARIKEQRNR